MTTIHQPHRTAAEAIPELDAGLLGRLHTGEQAAFESLYRHTADRLTRYVAARLRQGDRDAVDDLVQEAFCTALADPYLLGEDLLGSMLRLAARAVTTHRWSQRRYLRAAYTVYQDRTGQPAVVAGTTLPRWPGVTHALARLTPPQRRVVHLRYYDGWPASGPRPRWAAPSPRCAGWNAPPCAACTPSTTPR